MLNTIYAEIRASLARLKAQSTKFEEEQVRHKATYDEELFKDNPNLRKAYLAKQDEIADALCTTAELITEAENNLIFRENACRRRLQKLVHDKRTDNYVFFAEWREEGTIHVWRKFKKDESSREYASDPKVCSTWEEALEEAKRLFGLSHESELARLKKNYNRAKKELDDYKAFMGEKLN